MSFAGAEHQQDRGAAGRPRPEKRAEHAAGGDRRAQRLALEPLARQIGDRHRHPAQQAIGVGLAKRAELAAGLQQLDDVAGAGVVDRRRRRRRHRAQHRADVREAVEKAPGTARRPSVRTRGCWRSRARRRARGSTRARPWSARTHRPPAGRSSDRAVRDRASGRSAGSIAAACASVEHRNPGAISSVLAQPPTRSLRSRTVTFSPERARIVAVTRPLTPPPMTRTSEAMTFVVRRSTFVVHRSRRSRSRSSFGMVLERRFAMAGSQAIRGSRRRGRSPTN